MPVSATFRAFVVEQMGRVAPQIRAKGMFGGVGIYSRELFFALIDDDEIYLKVDDSNRADFEDRGAAPFRPFGPDGGSMQYYALPEGIIEDPESLREWVEKAIAVARRKSGKRRPRGRS